LTERCGAQTGRRLAEGAGPAAKDPAAEFRPRKSHQSRGTAPDRAGCGAIFAVPGILGAWNPGAWNPGAWNPGAWRMPHAVCRLPSRVWR